MPIAGGDSRGVGTASAIKVKGGEDPFPVPVPVPPGVIQLVRSVFTRGSCPKLFIFNPILLQLNISREFIPFPKNFEKYLLLELPSKIDYKFSPEIWSECGGEVRAPAIWILHCAKCVRSCKMQMQVPPPSADRKNMIAAIFVTIFPRSLNR